MSKIQNPIPILKNAQSNENSLKQSKEDVQVTRKALDDLAVEFEALKDNDSSLAAAREENRLLAATLEKRVDAEVGRVRVQLELSFERTLEKYVERESELSDKIESLKGELLNEHKKRQSAQEKLLEVSMENDRTDAV
eukprot:686416_1